MSYLSALSIFIATGTSDADKSAIPAIFSHPSVNVFATARASIAISMFLVFISFRFLKTVISSQTDGFCYICSVLTTKKTTVMITPKMKDDVINILCSGTFNFDVHYNVPKTAFLEELADKDDPSKSFTENQLVSIFSQFERMGLISGYANNSRTVEFEVLVEANDFYIHGGFQAQEEILKANIEKLSQELDLLSKQLSPDLLEKANKLTGISSAILSALSLFKS